MSNPDAIQVAAQYYSELLDAKQELAALRKKNEELQRQLDEAAKQEPVAWMDEYGLLADCEDFYFHIPLYRHPPNLPALIEQAKREERDALAMEVPAKFFCTWDSHVHGAYKNGWNDACDKMLAAIRARSGK